MKPTPKLRWIEREVSTPHPKYTNVSETKTVCILQQWWETSNTINLGFGGELPLGGTKGEWRDVPLEKEQGGHHEQTNN